MNTFDRRLRILSGIELPALLRPLTTSEVSRKLVFRRKLNGVINVLFDDQIVGRIQRNSEGRFYAFHNVLDKGSRGVPARITLTQAKEDFSYKQARYLQFGPARV